MDLRHKNNCNIGIGLGLLFVIAAAVSAFNFDKSIYGLIFVYVGDFVGISLFFWGCASYLLAKGYSPFTSYFSALFVLFVTPVIWAIVAFLIPDKTKSSSNKKAN